MSGHHHNSNAGTQNQGNSLGDRACVRQSKLYRTHESGNDVKSILGTDHLRWDTDRQEGAYRGQKVFDHNKPNTVTNELRERNDSRENLRERANDMKGNINYNYANDWSTESGSYKNDSSRGRQQPASSRDSYRGESEGALVRPSKYPSNSYSNDNDYQQQYPAARSGRVNGAASGGSSMGGQSLSQYQSDPSAYEQPAPRQQAHGRVSGNSDGFQAAMQQPERGHNETYQSSRGAGPQRSNSRNNIYGGSEEVPTYNAHPAAVHRQQGNQFNAPTGYGQGLQNQQGQYTQYPPQRAGPPQGQYQPRYEYEDDQDYQVPGIAAEGSSNREGRSTRPW